MYSFSISTAYHWMPLSATHMLDGEYMKMNMILLLLTYNSTEEMYTIKDVMCVLFTMIKGICEMGSEEWLINSLMRYDWRYVVFRQTDLFFFFQTDLNFNHGSDLSQFRVFFSLSRIHLYFFSNHTLTLFWEQAPFILGSCLWVGLITYFHPQVWTKQE